ncbi:hypothetical protein Dalk_4539 [Desulfatibacillum aliphaticivorans]|uniref:Uncharacterized protein n=1 Tax=Desulfatibacillum aliphaticivorans TaxID=218208 RepID=B8FCQ4_DESAL|nr:hypothetical protein [Desulfatibacillum aliphaticivorans]ACL06217.1 hypothetical protein Dalk_4539 [Desulfatibacillum aliphaticivorans]
MNPVLLAAIIEGARLALNAYFKYAEINGLTEEQINDLFDEERAKFDKRNPANLPEV